jgi:hypothetical protein
MEIDGSGSNSRAGRSRDRKYPLGLSYSALQTSIVICGGALSFLPIMGSLKHTPTISVPDELVVCGLATAALALISPLLVDWVMDLATPVVSSLSIEIDPDRKLCHFLSPLEIIIALCGLAIAPCVDLATITDHNSTASACARASRLVLVVGVIMKSLCRMNNKKWSERVVTVLILSLLIFAVSSVYSDNYQLLGDSRAGPLIAVKAVFGSFAAVSFYTLICVWASKLLFVNDVDPISVPDTGFSGDRSGRQSISSGLWRRLSHLSMRVNSERSIPLSGRDGRNSRNFMDDDSIRNLSDDNLADLGVLDIEKGSCESIYLLVVVLIFTIIFVAYAAAGNVYMEKTWGRGWSRIQIDVSFLMFALALNVINVRTAKRKLLNCMVRPMIYRIYRFIQSILHTLCI